jgi:hypothetical protein
MNVLLGSLYTHHILCRLMQHHLAALASLTLLTVHFCSMHHAGPALDYQSKMATMRLNLTVLVAALLLLTCAPSSLASRHLYQAPNDPLAPPTPGADSTSTGTGTGPIADALGASPAPGAGATGPAAGAASPAPAGGAGASLLPALGGGMMSGNNSNINQTAANITQTLGLTGTNATSLERCITMLDSYNITLVNGTTGEPLTGANATSMVGVYALARVLLCLTACMD